MNPFPQKHYHHCAVYIQCSTCIDTYNYCYNFSKQFEAYIYLNMQHAMSDSIYCSTIFSEYMQLQGHFWPHISKEFAQNHAYIQSFDFSLFRNID